MKAEHDELVERLFEALQAAQLQLEYLDERFPTGTTPSTIAKIERALRESLNADFGDVRERAIREVAAVVATEAKHAEAQDRLCDGPELSRRRAGVLGARSARGVEQAILALLGKPDTMEDGAAK